MKITVTEVGKGWKPDDAGVDFKPIYTIKLLGQSPAKTQDERLAVPGEHEAESYQSKSGKTYWRSVEAAREAQEKVFKADPVKQESIEWQACLKAAVQAVHDYHMVSMNKASISLDDYKKEIVNALVTFTKSIEIKPDKTFEIEKQQEVAIDEKIEDRPPVENYEELAEADDVDLSDIPF